MRERLPDRAAAFRFLLAAGRSEACELLVGRLALRLAVGAASVSAGFVARLALGLGAGFAARVALSLAVACLRPACSWLAGSAPVGLHCLQNHGPCTAAVQ